MQHDHFQERICSEFFTQIVGVQRCAIKRIEIYCDMANPFCDTFGPRREKTCLWRFANNKGADQPAHPRSLISAFLIRLLESIISRLATSEISYFLLVSEAEQAGLNLTF